MMARGIIFSDACASAESSTKECACSCVGWCAFARAFANATHIRFAACCMHCISDQTHLTMFVMSSDHDYAHDMHANIFAMVSVFEYLC